MNEPLTTRRFQCDGEVGCPNQVMRAPRMIVPHTFKVGQLFQKPRHMFTDLHYCEIHRARLDDKKLVQALLSPKVKADFERAAKLKWPMGYVCDFERAYIEWVLVTTPEYRAFLAALGYHGILGAAKLNTEEQQHARAALGVNRIAGM